MQSYTGTFGLPETQFATTSPTVFDTTKTEYRDTYLKIGATLLNIGQHNGGGTVPAGSGRLKINLGSVQTTATIYNSGTAADAGLQPIRLLGTHASNALKVIKGKVGVATSTSSEVSTILTTTISYDTSVDADAEVTFGPGVTWTTCTKSGGSFVANSAGTTLVNARGTSSITSGGTITTLTVDGGTVTTNGSVAVTTATVNAGAMNSNSTGTIASVTVGNGEQSGALSFAGSTTARTISACTLYKGTINLGAATLTFSTGILPGDERTWVVSQAA
jgi:trimeric autotransporter adhesin